jgi:hypothetical protein
MAFYNCPGCNELLMVPDGWPLPITCEDCDTTVIVESSSDSGDPDSNAFSDINLKPAEDALRLGTAIVTFGASEIIRKLIP